MKESCIFCHSSELDLLIPKEALPDKVNVLKCKPCELVFLESRTEANQLDAEETVYWDDEDQKQIYLEENIQEIFSKEFQKRISTIEELLGFKGRLLDVGCGVGHFLATAKKRGWQVQGLDISQAAKKAAAEVHEIEVEVGTLETSHLPSASVDVISLWDVIEHIRKPIENLKAANRLLRPNGILALKTPNETGLFKQLALRCYRMFGERAAFLLKYVYYVPHYFSYSKKSMNILLSRSGFEAVRYELDATPPEFAAEKINVHYEKDPKRSKIIALLPAAEFVARALGKSNKLIVYAKKVREVEP